MTAEIESAATVLQCTQCGGELQHDQGQIFVTCPYCASTVYLDKSQVVFHWYLSPTLDAEKAQGALARWMGGNSTVKDLDKKSRIIGKEFNYFPLWYFKRRDDAGNESLFTEPAAATSISEVKRLSIPAGDLRKYKPDLDHEAVTPTVPLHAARQWLAQRGVRPDEISENALVHLPLYTFKYTFKKKTYTALVEAATGRVLANIFPEKAEAPFQFIAGLTAIVFVALSLAPVIGVLFGEEGMIFGMMICLGLGIPAGILFFLSAAWIAARV